MDDNDLSEISTPVTKSWRKRNSVKTRFFGHSAVNADEQVVADNSVAYRKCCDQIGSKFGCIYVGEIALFDGTPHIGEKS